MRRVICGLGCAAVALLSAWWSTAHADPAVIDIETGHWHPVVCLLEPGKDTPCRFEIDLSQRFTTRQVTVTCNGQRSVYRCESPTVVPRMMIFEPIFDKRRCTVSTPHCNIVGHQSGIICFPPDQ